MNSHLHATEDIDDTFVLFRSPDHLEKLKNYLNSKYRNIRFICKKEQNNSMSFLDVLITRTSDGFKTSVYHKPTFSGVYSNFNRFISEEYKVDLLFTLLFRMFSVVSDFSRFHSEVWHLKEILKSAFPTKLIDSCIKNFVSKRLTEKPVTLTAAKIDLVIVLPCLGKLSLDLRTLLKSSISKNLPFCKIRVFFKSSTCISNFFQFRDKMP